MATINQAPYAPSAAGRPFPATERRVGLILPLRAFIRIGLLSYPAARVDHRFKDGDTIRVGPIALTAHVTGSHTRGCTTWSFPVPRR